MPSVSISIRIVRCNNEVYLPKYLSTDILMRTACFGSLLLIKTLFYLYIHIYINVPIFITSS